MFFVQHRRPDALADAHSRHRPARRVVHRAFGLGQRRPLRARKKHRQGRRHCRRPRRLGPWRPRNRRHQRRARGAPEPHQNGRFQLRRQRHGLHRRRAVRRPGEGRGPGPAADVAQDRSLLERAPAWPLYRRGSARAVPPFANHVVRRLLDSGRSRRAGRGADRRPRF
ncbi:hypothetical protein DFJ74DRAFT_683848 [Hyaloraphidium curvatum]|nr:hypothetical protein DFJ74DRAFT_683848 [Hyaloraphidium curvatum]